MNRGEVIKMTFSIIIPMFNASKSIEHTLESCIDQTYMPLEIIIVDDCSTDESLHVVLRWKEKYTGSMKILLKQLVQNSGPAKARNKGWDLATGEYIAFLDADDSFVLEKLATVHKVLKVKKNVILLGHEYGIGTVDESKSKGLVQLHRGDFLKKNYFTTSAVIVKRDLEERFDETMRYTEDQDLFLRLTHKYDKTYYLKQKLVLRDRRMNEEGGLSGNKWAMRKGEIIMYYKYCKTNRIMLLFPLFTVFSLSKHVLKMIKG